MKNITGFVFLICSFLITFNTWASIEVVGSLKHIHNAQPGDVIHGQIKIQNSGDYPQEVRVYQTDYLYNYENYTLYDPPVTHPRSNASWIEYSPQTTIVNSHEAQFIQYQIKIPNDTSLKGSFWSILMVEGVNPIDPEQKGKLSINTVTRYAIQIVNELDNKGLGELQFMEPTLLTEEGKLILAIDILNTGDHYISPEVSIEFFDDNGNQVKKIEANRKGLFPSTSARFRIDLQGLESNKTYQALIIAAGKNDDVFGLEYTLYF